MASILSRPPWVNGNIAFLIRMYSKFYKFPYGMFKGLIMDGCVLLTSTPQCVVSPRRAIPRAQPEGSPRGETTHSGVDVNNTHPSMINPDYNMILANLTLNYQYFAY